MAVAESFDWFVDDNISDNGSNDSASFGSALDDEFFQRFNSLGGGAGGNFSGSAGVLGSGAVSPENFTINPKRGLEALDDLAEKNDALNSEQFRVAMLAIYSIIALLSVVGNTLHCLIIVKSRNLQTMTNIFMAHLSVANVLFIVVFTPIFISKYVLLSEWNFGVILCKLCSSVSYFTGSASFFLMALVAIDRRLAIFTQVARINRKTGHVLIGATWFFSIVISLPFFIYANVTRLYLEFDFESEQETFEFRCRLELPEPYRRYAFLGTVILQYLVPLLIISPCYGQICVFLWRKKTASEDQNVKKIQKRQRRKQRTVLMLLAIVLIFILCWLPLFAITIVTEFQLSSTPISLSVFLICHVVASLSVCSSPYVYLVSDTFRQELKNLCSKTGCRRSCFGCWRSATIDRTDSRFNFNGGADFGASAFVNSDEEHTAIRRISIAISSKCNFMRPAKRSSNSSVLPNSSGGVGAGSGGGADRKLSNISATNCNYLMLPENAPTFAVSADGVTRSCGSASSDSHTSTF